LACQHFLEEEREHNILRAALDQYISSGILYRASSAKENDIPLDALFVLDTELHIQALEGYIFRLVFVSYGRREQGHNELSHLLHLCVDCALWIRCLDISHKCGIVHVLKLVVTHNGTQMGRFRLSGGLSLGVFEIG
jgi:hypothetical protein